MTDLAKRRLRTAAVALAAAYLILCGFSYWAMTRPPDHFGRIMSHVPMSLMAVLPFEPLWNIARAGELEVGDSAPDFELPTYNKSEVVRLDSFRGKSPVVLVFGSYT